MLLALTAPTAKLDQEGKDPPEHPTPAKMPLSGQRRERVDENDENNDERLHQHQASEGSPASSSQLPQRPSKRSKVAIVWTAAEDKTLLQAFHDERQSRLEHDDNEGDADEEDAAEEEFAEQCRVFAQDLLLKQESQML